MSSQQPPQPQHTMTDPIRRLASFLYGAAGRRRRRWHAGGPDRRRRLARPVVSVGNLALGGSGKTPVVAALARLLLNVGERPAILSRGYARQERPDGVVVVRDPSRVRVDLPRAGDEPLMLARALHGTSVLVSPDRYLAGRLAETHLDATVHILDDGFQHLVLERDVDLIVVEPDDLADGRVVPAGRLREPIYAARRVDAVLVMGGPADAAAAARHLGVARAFAGRRSIGPARLVEPFGAECDLTRDTPVVVVTGIARPARFLKDLDRAGVRVVDAIAYRDHHRFTKRDLGHLERRVRAAGAALVLTTEKDLMRLLPHRPLALPLAWVPMSVTIEPAEELAAWLRDRLAAARERRRTLRP